MYEEQPQGPTDVDNRPLGEKIGDKSWKARVSAYEELRKGLKSTLGDDPLFDEYAAWVPKMTADSNAGALDAGLDTALLFVDMCPQPVLIRQIADSVCTNVIDKAFGTRAGTLNKGKLLIMKLMEVDDCATCTGIMLSKLGDKKPKVPPTCLDIIKHGIAAFGARAFPIKEIIAAVGPVLNGSSAPSREAAMGVIAELYKWIGRAPFNSVLESMRPAQKTEFEKLCAEFDTEGTGVPTPSLYLRKNRPAPGAVEAAPAAGGKSVAAAEPALDAREFVEEIDLAKKMKASEYDALIAEEKWSEQLRGLQIVVDLLGQTPKIKAGTDVTDLLGVIKGFLRQGHVQLQVTSLKILALLADGLRAEFGTAVRPLTQAVVGKAKEKRLGADVQAALFNIVCYCVPMEALLDDMSEQMMGKKVPPHTRICIMEVTTKVIAECPQKVSTDSLKSLAEMNIACCEDSDVKVRDACSGVLGALAPLVRSRGRGAVEAHRLLLGLEQSAPRVFKKMQAAMEGAPPAAAPVAAAAAAPKAAAVPAPKAAPEKPAPKKAPPAAAKPSAGPARKATPSGAASRGPVGAADDKEDDNVDDVSMSVEDAQAALEVLGIADWDAGFQALASSSKWQEKVDACTALGDAIQKQSAGGTVAVPLVAYIKANNSNFKISNVNIVKAIMQLFTVAAQSVRDGQKFGKSAAWEIIKSFGDRFSDKKTLELSNGLMTALCEAASPSFVVKRMKMVMEKAKAPAAHQGYLDWLKGAIGEFGASAFPIQALAAFCREEMENKNAGVRTAAVEVVGALYHQIGPRVQAIAVSDDCKPQLRALLEAEFTKVGHDPAAGSRATRAVKGDDGAAAGGGLSIPRQDLTALLDKNILQEMNSVEGKNSWQGRKTAMEAVIAACEKSGHYLDGNRGTVEIVRAFKGRLNDTQANLKPIAAAAMAHVISSLECEVAAKVLKAVGGPLLASVADSKKAMRDAAIAAFEIIVTLNGASSPADASLMAAMLTHSVEALVNPVGRQELLQWIAGHADGPGVRCDCNDLAGSLVLCLQDKMAAVRTQAEGVLTSLISKGLINRGAVDKATRDLAPAAKRALQAPIERMLSSFGTKSIGGPVAAAEPTATIEATPAPVAPKRVAVIKAAPLTAAPAASLSRAETVEESVDAAFPFKKSNKAKRNDEFYKQNWPQPPEDISDNELANLKREWETQVTNSDIIHVLFPHQKFGMLSQEIYMNGAAELMTALQQSAPLNAISLAHTDFILRWCAFVLCTRETTQGTLKILQVITAVFELHRSMGIPLHDTEAGIVLPHLIDKSGHKSERHKNAFKSTLVVAEAVCSPGKMSTHLLQGLGCKNKKTRAVCLEELEHVVAAHGYTPLGRSGIKEVCIQFDSTDVGVRNAALDLAYALYVTVGTDTAKLYKLLGEVTDKAKSLIAGRIKERNKTAPNHPPPTSIAAHSVAPPQPPVAAAAAPVASRPVLKAVPADVLAGDKIVVLRGGSKPASESITITDNDFDGDVAFKLDMTPDGSEATPPARCMNDRTPAAEAVKVSLFGKSTPEPARDVSVDSVYAEIAGKVNIMITLYTAYVTKCRQSNSAPPVSSELITACDDCREYMKMLHAIVTGNWAKNGTTSASTADDEAVLLQNAEGLILMVITCMSLALEGIGVSSRRAADMPVASALDVDVSLMSVCLATLHALVKHPGVLGNLSNSALIELTADCVLSMSHEKLTKTTLAADAKEASEQMYRVLLLIMAKAAQEAGVVRMVNAVVQSLFQCISEVDHASIGSSTVTRRVLPTRCAKPLSKLLLKVLSDECRQHRPFVRLSAGEVSSMLLGLHMFFSNHPGDLKGDDTPYCAAKTVLSQLVKSIGAPSILMTLQQSLEIQPSSFICIMTARLGNTEGSADSNDSDEAVPNAVSPELHSALVTVIDDITSSRDKMGAIRKLHILIQSNPSLDVSLYLERTSAVFRRYVLDTLQKMDEYRAKPDSAAGADSENSNNTAPAGDGQNRPEDAMTGSEGFEAMRIIEGLKKKQNTTKIETPKMSRESSASRLAIHDKVRGSITSLQESLFAANADGDRALPVVTVPPPMVDPAAGVDDDLAARIARIRNTSRK